MFLQRTRGLLDLLLASACLWAAWYHTPLGAGIRSLAGLTFGVSSSARPLLSYYNGGVYGRSELGAGVSVPAVNLPPELPAADALGWGVYATLVDSPSQTVIASRVRSLALARGVPERTLLSPKDAPHAYARLIAELRKELGTEEAAVMALFCGYEPARYAKERLEAVGGDRDLERLAQQLPPGFDEEVSRASKAMMLGSAYGLAWPVSESAPITSGFGPRLHPILGVPKMHSGVDISLRVGTPVNAVAGGIVRRASEDAVNGLVLTVDHGRGVTTSYCHNSRLLVDVGQQVSRGQLISESGNTGRSTGPHLHYQLELGRVPSDPLKFRARRPLVVDEQAR